jgi:Fuc2NAc and GlcNAc transferase
VTPVGLIYVAGVALVVSVLLVTLVRRHATQLGMMDPVTPRSSHTVPVPRGGGIGFVVPLTVAVAVVPGDSPGRSLAAALTLAFVAVLGWQDDRRSLPIGPRLAGQVAAGLVVAALTVGAGVGGVGPATPAAMAVVWWVFWTVSCVNVVNFLDGIDGLVAGQGLVFAAFAVASSFDPEVTIPAIALAGGLLGFLAYNRPPARVFMGDVGSAALGIAFVVIGTRTMEVRGWTAIHAFLPLAPMFVDELMTMGRRVREGNRLWRPHRTHTYQIAARVVGHGPVSAGYAALSLAGGWVALTWPRPGLVFAVAATVYVALTALTLAVVHRAARTSLDRVRPPD